MSKPPKSTGRDPRRADQPRADAWPKGRAARGGPRPAGGGPREDKTDRSASADGPRFRAPAAELSVLYGFHAVREALASQGRKRLGLFATAAAAERLAPQIALAGLTPRIVTSDDLSRRLGPQAVHQGVLLEARPIEPIDLAEIVSTSGIVLVLDQITDPHNVGAILRTAAAFGVDALVTTVRHAPDFSGVVAKAASGGLEHVPVVEVVNLSRALTELGELGYLRLGLDSQAPTSFEAVALSRPLALVLGGEGKGMRRLTREKCDVLVRLDMPGSIKSLNVSNACAVSLTLIRMKLALP